MDNLKKGKQKVANIHTTGWNLGLGPANPMLHAFSPPETPDKGGAATRWKDQVSCKISA